MTSAARAGRPVPLLAVIVPCATLVALAVAMATSSIALASDGPYYLVRILESESVFSTAARFLGNALRQLPVLVALKFDVTDTQVLTTMLGVGQIVVPALIWCAAIVLARGELLAFTAVVMTAGLCAGTTWFCNVGEYVLAMPLLVVVSVLLWRAQDWGWLEVTIAVAAAATLVATYELVVLVSPLLVVWAIWRAVVARSSTDRYGAALVAALSVLAIFWAFAGVGARRHQSHTQSLLYYVVALEPWQFYAAALACVLVVVALSVAAAPVRLAAGAVALVCVGLVVATFTPDAPDAFKARGGTGLVVLALAAFLFAQWVRARRSASTGTEQPRHATRSFAWLPAVPVAFVVAMAAMNAGAIERWDRSLDEFRDGVNTTSGITPVTEVVSRDRRHVVWGWTSPSLSLIVRQRPEAGVLADDNPSFLPFAPQDARAQLDDAFTWPS